MFSQRLDLLQNVLKKCEYTTKKEKISEEKAIHLALGLLMKTRNQKGSVYVVGNGGSAGIASHFAIDLLNVFKISAHTLYDSNQMTCLANDYGYDKVFSIPLKTMLNPADLLVAISSSGKSPNILNAVQTAKEMEINIITLSGFLETNPLRKLGDLNFWLDAKDYGLVETGHFFLLHTIIDFAMSEKKTLVANEKQNHPSL